MDLAKFVKENSNCSIYPIPTDAKKSFHRKGQNRLRKLGKELGFKEMRVGSNLGGFGIWGDVDLYGMWDDTHGCMVQLCGGGSNNLFVMYRTIKHMKDYTGGSNNWLRPGEDAVEAISRFNKAGVK